MNIISMMRRSANVKKIVLDGPNLVVYGYIDHKEVAMIEIEAGIPVPGRYVHSGIWRPRIYPFPAMQVGDSFAAPADRANAVRFSAAQWKRRHPGWDYTSRVEGCVIRVWRTA